VELSLPETFAPETESNMKLSCPGAKMPELSLPNINIIVITYNKCPNSRFIHLLMATFKD